MKFITQFTFITLTLLTTAVMGEPQLEIPISKSDTMITTTVTTTGNAVPGIDVILPTTTKCPLLIKIGRLVTVTEVESQTLIVPKKKKQPTKTNTGTLTLTTTTTSTSTAAAATLIHDGSGLAIALAGAVLAGVM